MAKIHVMRCKNKQMKRIRTIDRKIRSGGRGKLYLPHVYWQGRAWTIHFLKGKSYIAGKVIYPWGKTCKKR